MSAEADGARAYSCEKCASPIAFYRDRISVEGKREASFRSPAGFKIPLGYFQVAAGISIIGERTAEYTWFPGYTYGFAMCAKCTCQIGWAYYKDDELRFYGLNLSCLRETDGFLKPD